MDGRVKQLPENLVLAEDTERAWAAGFFDGEGHISSLRNGTRIQMIVSQRLDGFNILTRFSKAVGVGKLYNLPSRPEIYRWVATSKVEVNWALSSLWPYLCEPKKLQAINAGHREERRRV